MTVNMSENSNLINVCVYTYMFLHVISCDLGRKKVREKIIHTGRFFERFRKIV